jgi:hypothetical protein
MNAVIAELAGTRLSKILNMVNTSMFVFKHPKYYKELRTRNKSDQAISNNDGLAQPVSVRPDPGHKPQATSSKPQASSIKLSNQPEQATSHKLQAPSNKRQA